MFRLKSPQVQPLDTLIIFLSALFLAQGAAIPILRMGVPLDSPLVFLFVAVVQDGLFLFLVYAFLKRRRRSWTDIRLGSLHARHLSRGLLAGMVLYGFMALCLIGLRTFLPGGLPPQNVEVFMDSSAPLLEKLAIVLVVVVLAPLAEEILFRGYFLQSLENIMPPTWAIFWSGIVFGLVHGDPYRFLPLALGGWILAYVARRWDSLWPPIIAHATWNAIMILIVYTT